MVSIEDVSRQYVKESITCSEHLPEKFYDLGTNENELENDCIKFAKDIANKKITLATFTTYLESFLTAQTAFNRKRGTWILSTVLEHLPKHLLTENEITILVRFYSERMIENHLVIPAIIKGICAIITMKHFPKNSTQTILSPIFVHIRFDMCSTSDRAELYRMLYLFLDLKTEEVKNMGLDFVNGVIQATDGERDPRNLLYIFNWLPKFFRTVTMSHLLEDCFEIISCYFPVDFRNRTENQNITRENLVEDLESCLCAVPEFGEHCIPLALEKLDSDLKNAVIDSLNLLIRGCSTFTASIYETHFFEIWHLLKKHLFTSSDSELQTCALKCLKSILRLLTSSSESSENKIISEILNVLKNETQKTLLITSKEFEIGTTTLLAVASADAQFCTHVMNCMVPTLLSQYYLADDYSQELKLLNILNEFCLIYLEFYTNLEESVYLTGFPKMLLTALNHKESEMRVCGWQGFTNILKNVDSDVKKELLNLVTDSILHEVDLQTRKYLYVFLEKFATLFEKDCNDLIIDSQYYDILNILELKNFLNALIILANIQPNAHKILYKLRSYCFSNQACYRIAFLECYKQITYKHMNVKNYIDHSDFIDHFIQSNLEYLESIDKIDTAIVSISKSILYNLIATSKYDIKLILNYIDPLVLKFEKTQNENRIIIVSLLYGLLIGLRRSDQLNNQKYVFEILLNAATSTSNELMLDLTTKILASMMNKWEVDSLDEIINLVMIKINDLSENESVEENVNRLLTWCTKALIMRNFKSSNTLIDKICDRLVTVKSMATSFALLLYNDDVLCPQNDCQISLLYRQKTTVNCLKQILQLRKVEKKLQYSVAILNLLIHLPDQLYVLYFSEVIEIIIECLDSNIPFLSVMALKKIEYIVVNENQIFTTYISDITPILLKLTSSDSMDVRLSALKCLEHFTSSPIHIITPFKVRVVHGLEKCLDDRKRIVRTQAIKTRLAWYKIGSNR